MTSVAVATSSQLAADAAREVAEAGGNAVDCALAASLLTMNTEPGVCALAGSAFVTIWRDGDPPITIDGNVAVPGKGLAAGELGCGTERIAMDYGGGIETLVGVGSVGVPGSLAAVEKAWEKYGAVEWATLFAPSIRAAKQGFPLSSACHFYLRYSGDCVYGRSAEGHRALHNKEGTLLDVSSNIIVPGLADTLTAIAAEGAELFYKGELGADIAAHCRDGNGALTRKDLEQYEAIERDCLINALGEWQLACNPAPAVGGAVLSAMMLLSLGIADKRWGETSLRQLIDVQRRCLDYRKNHLDLADDVAAAVDGLLLDANRGRMGKGPTSASTVHTSAVDNAATACAVTASSGYGAGEMPAGTGLWLNNSLGELELNRRGLAAGPVGSRLPSNMNPSVVRHRENGHLIAVGSPGADRITTAMQQFLINYLQCGMSLDDAIAHPRLHVDTSGEETRLMLEPGLAQLDTDLPVEQFAELGMYFGGIGVAELSPRTGLAAAADPRREGGTCIHAH